MLKRFAGELRRVLALVMLASLMMLGAFGSTLSRAATGVASPCPTIIVNATNGDGYNAKPADSVEVHPCERIKVKFVLGTQGTVVYLWQVTHKPTAPVLKRVSSGYGPNTSDTGTQIWVYRAVGTGKAVVKFRASSPGAPAGGTFTLKVIIMFPKRGRT